MNGAACGISGTALGLLALTQALAQTPTAGPTREQTPTEPPTYRLTARVIAVGLPGVAGVRQIGRFHHGGAIPGNPEFLLQTDAGRVLDPKRVMVAVASNFGAPKGNATHAVGAVLSIDPTVSAREPLIVPPQFAAAGGQTRAFNGALQLYSAQSLPFLNTRYNSGARSAAHAAVAGPRYVSINNAFGRPWIANAPGGVTAMGSVSVVDPDGAPLANAPSVDAGGVFAGDITNRRQVNKGHASTLVGKARNYRASPQLTAGALALGALGTAFLGPSPDGSGLAVFAAATADGAITQVHVQDGVDGLAAPGSVLPVDREGVIGMAFKWNPLRELFVADSGRNRLLVLHLQDDFRHFKLARASHFTSPYFKQPVDVAAAVPEIANPRFASHTTLAGGSDLYVANRGDGALVRVDQQGNVVARAVIEVPGLGAIGANRLRALAVSADAQRLWLTVQGELPGYAGHEGALIEVVAFDGAGTFHGTRVQTPAPAHDLARVTAGEHAFNRVFTTEHGLGPLFNERSCVACHPLGGASTRDEHFARRVARMDETTGRVTRIEHPNSPLARRFSTRGAGGNDAPAAALPREANVVSLRMPLALFASSAIDRVLDASIEAQAVAKGDGIKGRVHYAQGADGKPRIGRYGWKADIATLETMVADAFANELGINSALALPLQQPVEDDGRLVRAVAAFLRGLKLPGKLLSRDEQ